MFLKTLTLHLGYVVWSGRLNVVDIMSALIVSLPCNFKNKQQTGQIELNSARVVSFAELDTVLGGAQHKDYEFCTKSNSTHFTCFHFA